MYTTYQKINLTGGSKIAEITGLAKKFNLPLVFHCGFSHSSMRRYRRSTIENEVFPRHIAPIALSNPELKIVLAHMAKPALDDLIEVVNNYDNIYTDMSGLIDSAYEQNQIPGLVENLKKFLENCGPEKLMFGTDFPVQTHKDSVRFVEESMIDYSNSDKYTVYCDNAEGLFRI